MADYYKYSQKYRAPSREKTNSERGKCPIGYGRGLDSSPAPLLLLIMDTKFFFFLQGTLGDLAAVEKAVDKKEDENGRSISPAPQLPPRSVFTCHWIVFF